MALAGQGKTKGMVAQLAIDATCNQSLAAIVPTQVQSRYLFWWLEANYRNIRGLAADELRDGLNLDMVGGIDCPIPSKREQIEIARFLDAQTTKLDHVLLRQKALISLLQERKRAIIDAVVVSGLNLVAPMKDSGIAWLREIPAHWETRRARFIFREVDERSNDGSEELLSVSHLTGVTPRSEKNVNMFLAESYEGYKTCKADDLVINIMWAWMGALGIAPRQGIVSSAYGVYRFRRSPEVDPWYFDHLLRTPQYIGEYNRRSKGINSSRLRLYSDSFFDIRLLLPPLKEQEAIVAHIKEKSAAIDAAIAKIEREIELVQEYRTVLISEAVTGKLRIPELEEAAA